MNYFFQAFNGLNIEPRAATYLLKNEKKKDWIQPLLWVKVSLETTEGK